MNFDIEQFLDMKNEEILKENNGKKHWDVCLMNPPYGTRIKNEPLHFRFVEKCNKIADKQVTIMPFKIIKATSERDKEWKDKLSKNLVSVQEEDSKQFEGTGMPNVGIYYWDSSYNSDINIKYINEPEVNVKSLLEISTTNSIEENIFNYLYNPNILLFNLKIRSPKYSSTETYNNERKKLCEKFRKKSIYKDKWFLSVLTSNWGKNAQFISKKTGNIYNNFDDICDDWINGGLASLKYIVLDNKNTCERILDALQRPLLRLPLYRIQDDQAMNNKCYMHIPDIDWADDRVKTDEGLLEVCGCPKDKAKEYTDYCKKVINKLDNK